MRGSEYDEQDKKAAILYEYETFKAIQGEQLLDTYLRDVNDALGYKKKAVVVTSDPLALVAEKTKVSKRKEKVVDSSDSEASGADDFSELKKITVFSAKAFNRRKFYSKPTNNNLRTSSIFQSANKKQEFVKSDDKKVKKKDDEKKMDMSKVKPPVPSLTKDGSILKMEPPEPTGLWYPKGTGVETIVYVDSDHAGDYVDRKSTSGVCTFMGCCLTSWLSKKQIALAISTTEVEYVSAEKACQQALWMKQALVADIKLDDVPILCDNKGVIDLSKNHVLHSRTKHIEIRYHFLRDNVQKGNISIEKISSEDNITNILTKPLKQEPSNLLRIGLGLMEPNA
nr:copia protein [Tanacetum cinerariifolium]